MEVGPGPGVVWARELRSPERLGQSHAVRKGRAMTCPQASDSKLMLGFLHHVVNKESEAPQAGPESHIGVSSAAVQAWTSF